MTTKTGRLPYRIRWHIDYESLEFDPGKSRISDDMHEHYVVEDTFHLLAAHLDSVYPDEDVFRGSRSFICYDPANPNVRISPDYYVAIGVDTAAIIERLIYIPEEVGKPPDLAIEFASAHTYRRDMREKPAIYAAIGVSEYWRFDPTGGAYYGYPLAGDRLVGGQYEPIELTTEPDGILKGYSRILRVSLCWQDDKLKFYNPETGSYLTGFAEERAARQAAEYDREAERAARQAAEYDREAERVARQAAEARIRQLEEQLRRQQG